MSLKNKQPWSKIGAENRQDASYLSRNYFCTIPQISMTCPLADNMRKAYPYPNVALKELSFKTKAF